MNIKELENSSFKENKKLAFEKKLELIGKRKIKNVLLQKISV